MDLSEGECVEITQMERRDSAANPDYHIIPDIAVENASEAASRMKEAEQFTLLFDVPPEVHANEPQFAAPGIVPYPVLALGSSDQISNGRSRIVDELLDSLLPQRPEDEAMPLSESSVVFVHAEGKCLYWNTVAALKTVREDLPEYAFSRQDTERGGATTYDGVTPRKYLKRVHSLIVSRATSFEFRTCFRPVGRTGTTPENEHLRLRRRCTLLGTAQGLTKFGWEAVPVA
jgi:hypothetical protein